MKLSILAGSANEPLATLIAGRLEIPLTPRRIARFPDGELDIELAADVRGHDVCIVQSTGPPPDEHLIELLLLADAARRSGARSVTAVIPYFGYARQDHDGRRPVAAAIVARAIEASGVDRLVALDLHSAVVAGFFRIPVEHVSATGLLAEGLRDRLPRDAVVVAPDLGAVKLADRYARALDLPVAFIHKERVSGAEVEVRGVTGEVAGRCPVLVDDMISTGGTLAAAADALLAAKCRPEIFVAATHALLVGPAIDRLRRIPLRLLLVTDSVRTPPSAPLPRRAESVAGLLADAIRRVRGAGGPA